MRRPPPFAALALGVFAAAAPARADDGAEAARALREHDFRGACVHAERAGGLLGEAILADALVELGQVDAAEAVVERMPPGGLAYFRASYLLHLRGDDDRALELMRAARESLDPRASHTTHTEIGDLLWLRGDLEGAKREYERAARALPQGAAYAGLGRIAAARGELEEASRCFEQAATLGDPALISELAFVRDAAGRKDDARRAVERGVEIGRADPKLARSLALLLADHALDVEHAVDLAAREVADRPSIHSWDALSWALLAAGKPAEAYVCATRATALGTKEPLLLFHAGMAAAAAGKREEARARLGEALRLNPAFHVKFAAVARERLRQLEK